jgi:GTP-binding protein
MDIKSVDLETVCGITSTLPQNNKIEMAFWGRSNVGKSSLINTLVKRKSLARISSQPGKTQTINYYNLNNQGYLVDLPGYGYAKISREVADKWMKMIWNYLETSTCLRVVFLLVDIRHEPSKKDVENYKKLVKLGFNPLLIATKADKISKGQKDKHISIIKKTIGVLPETPVIPFSAVTKEGRDEIWEYMNYFMEEIKLD